MDIQVASNFERLLFEASGRDSNLVDTLMREFSAGGGLTLPQALLTEIKRDFVSCRVSESVVAGTIRTVLSRHDMLIDPHTAVGVAAHEEMRRSGKLSGPIITLATAHPAKFPEAVEAASGRHPELPPQFDDLFERSEKMIEAPCDVGAIRDILMQNA